MDEGAEFRAAGWGAVFGEGPGGVEGAVVICGGGRVDRGRGGGDGGEEELGGEAVEGGAEGVFFAGEGPAVEMSVGVWRFGGWDGEERNMGGEKVEVGGG